MKRIIISFAAVMTFLPAVAYAESDHKDVKVNVVDGEIRLVSAQTSYEAYCLQGGINICHRNCDETYHQMKTFCQSQPGDIYGEMLMQCLDYTESEYQSCKDQCDQPCAGEA